MNFPLKLNKDCEFEIVSLTLDNKYRNILNLIVNARENFDNDFFAEVSVFRTKRFQTYYAEFSSTGEFDVLDMIENALNAEAKRLQDLEDLECKSIWDVVNAELDAALSELDMELVA